MSEINLLKDASFLHKLSSENIKVYYAKILILDKNEQPIRAIEGRISAGSISLNGNSNVRRTGNITFLAEETENDLTDIDNLLSMNKKINIFIGIENNIDDIHDKIIWFKQGIFVITQPSLQHNSNGVIISLQFKDKMCLLNGECGGGLPTSVTFHEYDQIIGYDDNDGRGYTKYPNNPNVYTVYAINGEDMMWDPTYGWSKSSKSRVGEIMHVPQRIFDIIQTLVCNFGDEAIAKIIVEIPLEIRAIVRYVGTETLFYNDSTGVYTEDSDVVAENPGLWRSFKHNEDCGYVYTDFTYPGELISSIGENICSVLDKIKNTLGNCEYFYDINGNFIFREKKNYLNTQYDPVQKLDENGFLLNSENYFVDFSNTNRAAYTFEEGSALVTSFSNSPQYTNIKNDYHIWGKNDDSFAIHYHVAIKEKPLPPYSEREVVAERDEKGDYTGVIHLATVRDIPSQIYKYTPNDWRAELYMRGLDKKKLQQRPDVYEQEILDFFDSIYDMRKQEYKVDIVNHPNDLKYWIDYINPSLLYDISIDTIGTRIYSYQKDKIKKLYNTDIPNIVIINNAATALSQATVIAKCEAIGQPYSRVPKSIYDKLVVGTYGYTSQETMRDLIYQYTSYNSAISIVSIPIYYLDVNERITVQDRASGIFGDYVINSINLPLDAKNTMTISASKALERV